MIEGFFLIGGREARAMIERKNLISMRILGMINYPFQARVNYFTRTGGL